MADIVCPHCRKTFSSDARSYAYHYECPLCRGIIDDDDDGDEEWRGEGIEDDGAAMAQPPSDSIRSNTPKTTSDRTLAEFDKIDRSITLKCPACGSNYDLVTPLSVSEIVVSPSCHKCHAPYPMACQDCGIDLTVDGFEARPLKHNSIPEEYRPYGLWCGPCAGTYDRFAVAERELKQCTQCGILVAPGELRLRSFNNKAGVGARSWSWTEYAGLCAACAARADESSKKFVRSMISMFLLVAGLLILLLGACILSNGFRF